MTSLDSILKSAYNLKNTKIEYPEVVRTQTTKWKEAYERQDIHLHVRPYRKAQRLCPVCGRQCPGYDTKQEKESKWRAPNINGVRVYLLYQPKRIKCPEHGVLTEAVPWADGKIRFTRDFSDEVTWMATQTSKTAVADYMGIDWRSVGNCIKATHSRLEPDVSQRIHNGELKRICVDETSYRKGYLYVTVVYDMDRNQVIWIHKERSAKVFGMFCEELTQEERERIEIVAGDGAQWIDTCVKKYFPNAHRCTDPFHVTEWATEAMDRVRIDTARKAEKDFEKMKKAFREEEERAARADAAAARFLRLAEAERDALPVRRGRPDDRTKRLREFPGLLAFAIESSQTEEVPAPKSKGRPPKDQFSPEHTQALAEQEEQVKGIKDSKHALGHRPENRTSCQDEKIKLIEANYPDVYLAFQLKERLRLILHLRDEELAAQEIDQWITDAASCGLAPMEALAEKIGRHRENILNSIRYGANSSRSEATNTTIKALIKIARGFRNLENMKALIYLRCSDLVIPLNNRPQPTAEMKKAQRERANARRRAREEKRRVEKMVG